MAGKVKILFIIGSFATGGKERQLAELIKGLSKDKHEIHLLIRSESTHYINDLAAHLSSIYNLNSTKIGLKGFFKIASHINKIKPTILHSWAINTSVFVILARLLTIRGFIFIDGSIRNAPHQFPKFSKEWFMRRFTNLFSDSIVSNSKAGLLVYKTPLSKSICIWNGFDFNRLQLKTSASLIKQELNINTRFVVGMVARLDKFKDWQTFLEAARIILHDRDDVTFIAIGGGNDLEKHKQTIKNWNLERFVFTGERSDVENIVNMLDVGVLASFSEGISNTIMEYMAMAKPVVASGAGGINELVIHNQTGFIYEIGNSEQLAKYILNVINNEKLGIEMGLDGKKRIENYFNITQMVFHYEELYQNLITRNGNITV